MFRRAGPASPRANARATALAGSSWSLDGGSAAAFNALELVSARRCGSSIESAASSPAAASADGEPASVPSAGARCSAEEAAEASVATETEA